MGYDVHAQAFSLHNRRAKRLHRVLRRARVGGRGEIPARGHDLDEVGAQLDLTANRLHHFVDRVSFGSEHPAVAGGRGDGRSGEQQPRPGHDAGFDSVTNGERNLVAGPEVPHRRDPGKQGLSRRADGPHNKSVVVLGRDVGVRLKVRAAMKVGMSLDQPREQRHIAQVVHPHARRVTERRCGNHGLDAACIVRHNGVFFQPAVGIGVGDPAGFENGGLGQVTLL